MQSNKEEENYMKKLTVITPTYNRIHTLPKVYDSLVKQSNQDFLWLVIDDGSIDDTETLVRAFINENKIEIKYEVKNNGGKASAINRALDLVETPYCTCLDSDDWFDCETIEKVIRLLDEEKNNSDCCGILAIRNNPDGSIMGNLEIPQKYRYINMDELYNDLNFRSELICFYKSDIAKQFRFPVFENEKFMPPSWFHYAVCEKHKFRTSRDCLCYCEYIDDGLTKNKRKVIVKNPNGYTLIKRISFEHSKGIKRKFKNGIMYVVGTIIAEDKEWFKNAPHKVIVLASYPLAWFVYFKRFKKLKKVCD